MIGQIALTHFCRWFVLKTVARAGLTPHPLSSISISPLGLMSDTPNIVITSIEKPGHHCGCFELCWVKRSQNLFPKMFCSHCMEKYCQCNDCTCPGTFTVMFTSYSHTHTKTQSERHIASHVFSGCVVYGVPGSGGCVGGGQWVAEEVGSEGGRPWHKPPAAAQLAVWPWLPRPHTRGSHTNAEQSCM